MQPDCLPDSFRVATGDFLYSRSSKAFQAAECDLAFRRNAPPSHHEDVIAEGLFGASQVTLQWWGIQGRLDADKRESAKGVCLISGSVMAAVRKARDLDGELGDQVVPMQRIPPVR